MAFARASRWRSVNQNANYWHSYTDLSLSVIVSTLNFEHSPRDSINKIISEHSKATNKLLIKRRPLESATIDNPEQNRFQCRLIVDWEKSNAGWDVCRVLPQQMLGSLTFFPLLLLPLCFPLFFLLLHEDAQDFKINIFMPNENASGNRAERTKNLFAGRADDATKTLRCENFSSDLIVSYLCLLCDKMFEYLWLMIKFAMRKKNLNQVH